MFTLRNEKKVAFIPLIVYIAVTVVCVAFGLIYESFSHGIISYNMLFGFLWPLIGGVIFYLLNFFFNKEYLPSLFTADLYNAGIATLTVGCYFKGVLEIYGTTREFYVITYNVIGIILLSLAIIGYIYGLVLRLKQSSKSIN